MPRPQFSLKALLLAFTAIAVLFGMYSCIARDPYLLASFDCGQDRSIRVYVNSFCEVMDSPTYEVREHGVVISPNFPASLVYFCGDEISAIDLKLVTAEDGNLVGVVQVSTGALVLIYDFKSGKSFPRDAPIDNDLRARLGLKPEQ